MKRTLLLAATLAFASTAALAEQPEPSFKDYVELPKQVVTANRTFQHQFPKSSYASGTGPKGPATVLIQSIEERQTQALFPKPSFSG